MLQDRDGQVTEAHSISAGLDYPGVGPQLAALYEAGRLEVVSTTDDDAVTAIRDLSRTEGILPALEPAHALAALPRILLGRTRGPDGPRPPAPLPADALILVGLSGRGDKDLAALERREEAAR
jgi:tryptophan synthase beta chain